VLSLISLISFLLAGATLFLIRLPQVSRESQEDLRVEVSDLSLRSEAMLGAIQTQLELIATALRNPGTTPEKTLERALGRSSAFTAIYQVDRDGRVINASLKSWLGQPAAASSSATTCRATRSSSVPSPKHGPSGVTNTSRPYQARSPSASVRRPGRP